jgi:hypothetical protein
LGRNFDDLFPAVFLPWAFISDPSVYTFFENITQVCTKKKENHSWNIFDIKSILKFDKKS